MPHAGLDNVLAEIAQVRTNAAVGRVMAVGSGVLDVGGLAGDARVGDLVAVSVGPGALGGEVVSISGTAVSVLIDGNPAGLAIGAPVVLQGPCGIAPDDSWIGRVIDPMGRPLDGQPILRGHDARPLLASPPPTATRRGLGARLDTGLAVMNTLLPLVRGQRIGLFAGSGVGKSTLLAMLAQGVAADVVVIALAGERSREVRSFVDHVLGAEGMKSAIVVAASSDQSPLMRRRCLWTAMAIAEHFRDTGNHVLLLADSITRFAEAHREVAVASGEGAELRGFPPSVAHVIPALCERAGPGDHLSGDITAIFTVLVAGSDMEEPIADIMRGVLDGHIVLDRAIAERGRFPAIDVLGSVSRSLPEAATPGENEIIARARSLLGIYARSELMVQAGLYERGSDASIDAAIAAYPKLDAFFGQRAYDGIADSFEALATCLE